MYPRLISGTISPLASPLPPGHPPSFPLRLSSFPLPFSTQLHTLPVRTTDAPSLPIIPLGFPSSRRPFCTLIELISSTSAPRPPTLPLTHLLPIPLFWSYLHFSCVPSILTPSFFSYLLATRLGGGSGEGGAWEHIRIFADSVAPPCGGACCFSGSVREASSLLFPLPFLFLFPFSFPPPYPSCVNHVFFLFTQSPTLHLNLHCDRRGFILGPEGKSQSLRYKKGLALESWCVGFSPSSATDS